MGGGGPGRLVGPGRFVDPAFLHAFGGEIYGGAFRSDPDLLRRHAQALWAPSNRGYLYQLIAAAGWTSLPWLPLLPQPTLVMHGSDDSILPPINARILSSALWAPLDRTGDVEGPRWHDGHVAMPEGFHVAYRQFVEAGWNGLRFGAEYGGQGLPKLVDAAVMEMWNGANLGFSLVSLLTQGAIEA